MELGIAWWNVESFAHFDPNRRIERRWPDSEEAYRAKLESVATVIRERLISAERPTLLGLGEITKTAAESLRDLVLPGYHVLSPELPDRPDFNVAFIYPPEFGFLSVRPLAVQGVPPGTRPMSIIDLVRGNHRIRFIGCHWTARFNKTTERNRNITARQLGWHIHRYFAKSAEEQRHVVVMGDMNDEPFGVVESELHAYRSRARATQVQHWQDKHTKRKYLYNLAWRYMGERRPFGFGMAADIDSAGTYFYEGEWYTFDHLIVDGSLLSEPAPFINEGSTHVITHPLLFAGGATPKKFAWKAAGDFVGVSDHLPITTTLRLEDV